MADKLIGNENNILFYKDEELSKNSTCAKIAHMGNDGKQTSSMSCVSLFNS